MDFGAVAAGDHSARMYTGPGTGPMLAAAAAWTGWRSTQCIYRPATSPGHATQAHWDNRTGKRQRARGSTVRTRVTNAPNASI